MATFLFDSVIFGPIVSRRLGISLGINLLPTDNKLCNFDCVYCECGWNTYGFRPRFNSRETVREELEKALLRLREENMVPDSLTFAGNGEPTLHPDFEAIIEDTLALRKRYAPKARVAVLSNATMLERESVVRALRRVDDNILKIDSAFDATARAMNRPNSPSFSITGTVDNIRRSFGKEVVIQTMFLRGTGDGTPLDNTTETEIAAWVEIVKKIAPRKVMIYTIDRDTPCGGLEKIPLAELERIATRVREAGIDCSVSG